MQIPGQESPAGLEVVLTGRESICLVAVAGSYWRGCGASWAEDSRSLSGSYSQQGWQGLRGLAREKLVCNGSTPNVASVPAALRI